MKVGLNATCLNDRPSGARQRFVGIYPELVRRLPDVEFVVFEPADCRVGSWFADAPNVSVRRTPLPSEGSAKRFVHGLNYWHSALLCEKFDLFEGFNLPLIKAPKGRTLMTIHDLRGLHAERGVLERAVSKKVLKSSLRSADHIVTVSHTMKKEILDFYPGIPISVIYNGLDAGKLEPVPASELLRIRQELALREGFILAVGHLEKRKNYLRLIDAMALLRDRGRFCSLVIIGNDSGERKSIEERIGLANLSDRVTILSGLSDLEVRAAYQLCSLFVFPSLYEGFGIPILEGMAANRPMVLSDIPVFREITQDQGVYFAPNDVESMASAIEKGVFSNSERTRLVKYGKERVQAFNFHGLAAQIERLYRALL